MKIPAKKLVFYIKKEITLEKNMLRRLNSLGTNQLHLRHLAVMVL